METIILQTDTKENKEFLLSLFKRFNFINKINVISEDKEEEYVEKELTMEDIKECFGLWKDRDITKDSLRRKAWRNGK